MNNQNSSRLRYMDARELDTDDVHLKGTNVYGWEHEKLGDLEGFVGDAASGRLYYAVVDSGGWFSSRQFLLPIGHLLEYDDRKHELQADVSKEALRDLPEYDRDRFSRMSDDDLRQFQQRTNAACCPQQAVGVSEVWIYDTAAHHREPEWSRRRRTAAPNAGPAERRLSDERRLADDRHREEERRRDTVRRRDEVPHREYVSARDRDDEPMAEAGEVSPHLGGRAQPGDVLGVETGGERSHLGDTSKDENQRRRNAEEAASKQRESE